jgi:phosphoribosyl-AMP cyclohydrolase
MDFSKLDGLIPAVIQDEETSEVLMVGFMNEEALALTRSSGYATFFSRTRNTLWMKGETSGNRLRVVERLCHQLFQSDCQVFPHQRLFVPSNSLAMCQSTPSVHE